MLAAAPIYNYLILTASAFAVCWGLIFLLLRSPLVRWFSDPPNERKVHQRSIPRLGGVGIILAFLTVEAAYRFLFSGAIPQVNSGAFTMFLFTGVFLLVGGGLDDVRPMGYKTKFLLQFFLAVVVVTDFDIRFENIHFLGEEYYLGHFSHLLSILWLVGAMNAFNIIDGIDGLAATIALLGFAAVSALAMQAGAPGIATITLILIGILAGFLVHNFSSRRKIFLGDTGSLFLGAALGIISIKLTRLPGQEVSIFVPLLVMGYPFFDLVVAMIRRFTSYKARQGDRLRTRFVKMFQADNNHLHHRLVHWGLSHLQATFLLSLIAATMGAVAVIITQKPPLLQAAILGYLAIALLLVLNRLGFLGRRHWLTFPRFGVHQLQAVGVVAPDEVFFHSLCTLPQPHLRFEQIPALTSDVGRERYAAIVVQNTSEDRFEADCQTVLRAQEIWSCPVFFIAPAADLQRLAEGPRQFQSIFLMKMPVRVPELVERISHAADHKEGGIWDPDTEFFAALATAEEGGNRVSA